MSMQIKETLMKSEDLLALQRSQEESSNQATICIALH